MLIYCLSILLLSVSFDWDSTRKSHSFVLLCNYLKNSNVFINLHIKKGIQYRRSHTFGRFLFFFVKPVLNCCGFVFGSWTRYKIVVINIFISYLNAEFSRGEPISSIEISYTVSKEKIDQVWNRICTFIKICR